MTICRELTFTWKIGTTLKWALHWKLTLCRKLALYRELSLHGENISEYTLTLQQITTASTILPQHISHLWPLIT